MTFKELFAAALAAVLLGVEALTVLLSVVLTVVLGASVLAATLLLALAFFETSAVVLATDQLDAISVLGAAVLAAALLLAVVFWVALAVVLARVMLDAMSFERPLAVLLAVPLEAAPPDGLLTVPLAAVLAALVLPSGLPALLLPSPEVVLPSPAAAPLVSFAGFSVVEVGGSTISIAGRVLVKVMVVVEITVLIVDVIVATATVVLPACSDLLLMPGAALVLDTLSDGGTKGHATPWALQHHFFCSAVQLVSAFSNWLQSKHPTFSLRQHHVFFGADHS